MKRELEAGDNPEIATAATQRPEEVAVLALRRVHRARVRGHNLCPHHVVAAQTGLLGEPAHASAERQSAHPCVADEASRRGQPMLLGCAVESLPGGPAPARGNARHGVDAHVVHCAEVDHEAAVAHGMPGVVVAPATDGDLQAVVARVSNGAGHIVRRRAAGDQSGPAIDGPVPDRPSRVIARVRRGQDTPREARSERLDVARRQPFHVATPVSRCWCGDHSGRRAPPTIRPTLPACLPRRPCARR